MCEGTVDLMIEYAVACLAAEDHQEIAKMIGQRTWRASPCRPVKSDECEEQQEFEL